LTGEEARLALGLALAAVDGFILWNKR
jgi:hypothetical protein